MSLSEIPPKVYAMVGTRGLHPISLRECLRCGCNDSSKLRVVDKRVVLKAEEEADAAKEVVEYIIKCESCGESYALRLTHVYSGAGDKRVRITTFVHLYTVDGVEEGWLGNY